MSSSSLGNEGRGTAQGGGGVEGLEADSNASSPPRPSMQALTGPGEREGFVRRTARLLYDDCFCRN